MPWTTLTTDEAVEEFNDRELAALNQIKGNTALGGTLDRAVAEFRGAILAGGYPLGDEGTLPDALKSHCIALARWRFLVSIGKNEALQTPDRKDAFTAAKDILAKISAQEYAVEPPTGQTGNRAGNWNSENKLAMRTHPVPRPPANAASDYANDDGPADAS